MGSLQFHALATRRGWVRGRASIACSSGLDNLPAADSEPRTRCTSLRSSRAPRRPPYTGSRREARAESGAPPRARAAPQRASRRSGGAPDVAHEPALVPGERGLCAQIARAGSRRVRGPEARRRDRARTPRARRARARGGASARGARRASASRSSSAMRPAASTSRFECLRSRWSRPAACSAPIAAPSAAQQAAPRARRPAQARQRDRQRIGVGKEASQQEALAHRAEAAPLGERQHLGLRSSPVGAPGAATPRARGARAIRAASRRARRASLATGST